MKTALIYLVYNALAFRAVARANGAHSQRLAGH